jgi:thiamine-phosphate pyrophosphorylase
MVTVSGRSGAERRERLERARLYLVIEAAPGGRPAAEIVGPALEGGVDVVQLREKHAPAEAITSAGSELRRLCHRHGGLLVVNDRADLALACGADGVHVGQEDEDPEAARALVGPDLLVGVSTHSPSQIEAAERSSADYLGVGPVHATATKPGVPAVGLGLVRHAAAHAGKPFFAIGGIDAGNAGEAAGAGAPRVAVVRAIRDAPDPRDAAAALLDALDRAHALAAR